MLFVAFDIVIVLSDFQRCFLEHMAGHSDKVSEGMQARSIDSLLEYSEEVSLSIVLFVVVVMMNLAKNMYPTRRSYQCHFCLYLS